MDPFYEKKPRLLRGILYTALLFLLVGGVSAFYLLKELSPIGGLKSASVAEAPRDPGAPSNGETPFYKSIGRGIAMSEHLTGRRKVLDSQGKSFVIEFLLTKKRSEAESLVASLQKKGITAYYMPLQREGEIFYRVRSMIFANESMASSELARMKKLGTWDLRTIRL
jgi:hypothetical protein